MPLARNLAQKVSRGVPGGGGERVGVLRGPGFSNMTIVDANSPYTVILLGNQ